MNEKLRILVVEDNPDDADLIREMLPQTGSLHFQIHSAQRLSEAVARLKLKDIDFVLLDLGLPDSRGLQTFRELQKAAPDIPVIVLSGNDDQDLAITAVQDGALDYLVKDQFSGGTLVRTIRHALERRKAEDVLRESELRFRHITGITSDIAYSCCKNAAGDYALDWIAGAVEQTTGYQPEEIRARGCWRFLVVEEDEHIFKSRVTGLALGESAECELRLRHKDGGMIWVSSLVKCVQDGDQPGTNRLYGGLVNITERKQAENNLQKSNRALRLISRCNQEMVRAMDEMELLQSVCRLAVNLGGYRMAWVGFAEHDEARSVRPAAHAGFEEGYLDTFNGTWADVERGRGPTGTAIRTGQPVYFHNLSTNPAFSPWRAAALHRGYASSIALPLLDEGRCFGALSMYAGKPDALDSGEIELLTEMAGNFAFGIVALRQRAERARAETELHRSENQIRSILESTGDGILALNREGNKVITANRRFAEMWGMPQTIMDAGDNRAMLEFARAQLTDPDAFLKKVRSLYGTDAVAVDTLQFKDGRIFERHGFPMMMDGAVTGRIWAFRNITERKRADMRVIDALNFNQTMLRASPVGIVVFKAAGPCVSANETIAQIAGGPREAVLKQNFRQLESWKNSGMLAAAEAALAAQEERDLETESTTTFGRKAWFSCRFAPFNHEGESHLLVIISDITARKQAELALRESERRFQTLAISSPVGIFQTDAQGRTIYVNPQWCEIAGLPAEKALGDGWLRAVHPEDRGKIAQGWQAATREQGASKTDYRLVRPDGTIVWVMGQALPEKDDAGRMVGYVGTIVDITERKQAGLALMASEVRYRRLFETAKDGILILDAVTGKIMDVNPFLTAMLGLSHHDLLGKKVWRLGFFKGIFANQTQFEKLQKKEYVRHEDLPLETKDGRRIHVEFVSNVYQVDRQKVVQCNLRDITERKQAQAALLASEKRYQLISSVAFDYVFSSRVQPDGQVRLEWVAGAFERMTGYTLEEFVARGGWRATLHPDDRAVDERDIAQLRAGQRIVTEMRTFTKSGQLQWVRVFALPVMDEASGQLTDIHGAVQDITERKRAEEALRTSEARFRTLIERSPVAISISRSGKHIYANRKFLDLYGFQSVDELVGKMVSDQWALECREMVAERAQKRARGEPAPSDYEGMGQRKDGSQFPVHVSVALVELSDGTASMAFLTDITERKRAEVALRESQALYHSLVEQLPVGVFRKDAAGRYVLVNPWFLRLKGLKAEDFLGKTPEEVAGEVGQRNPTGWEFKYAAVGRGHHEQIMQTGKPIELVEEYTDAGGRKRFVHSIKLPILEPDGKIIGTQGILFDITAIKLAEAALRDSEAFLNTVIEKIPHMIFVKDAKELRFVKFNQAGQELLGYSLAELIGKNDYDLFPKEMADYFTERDRKVLQGREVVDIPEEQVQTRNQGERILHTKKIPVFDNAGKLVYLMGISEDITESKRMEAALIRERDLWRSLLDDSPDKIYFKDTQSRFVKCSRAMAAQFGLKSPDELAGRTDFDFFDESHARPAFEDEQEIIRTGRPMINREEREESKDGRVTWVTTTKLPWLDDAGKIIGTMGISRDITERKLAEQQVKEALDFNRTIVLDAAVGITAFKASGPCVLANDTAAKILNGTVPRLLAMDFRKLESWRAASMLQIAEEVLATKKSRHCDVNFVSSFGREVWLVSHFSHFVQNGESHLLHVFSDVTEKKKLEAQFLRAQRMESIGTLAGGIAHDLNNVLTPLLFSVQILKEKISDDEGQQILESLEANVHRGANLVKQVLAFGRGIKGDRVLLQVRNIAREIEKIARETFPKSVQFQMEAAADLWTVSCDPTQIHQVLLNLCVNARDAMPNGGQLSLCLNNVTLDEGYAGINLDARPGPYVVISVEDTGTGIPREIQERIFEPFFTTKELDKGTGLGLSTSLAIVKSHGGFIHCYSEPGKGSDFKVYLPANATSAAAADEPAEPSPLPRGHDELVLVVDDEAPIRELAQYILEHFGYRVLQAINGVEAVQLYNSRRDEIAVVITDMAMPVMDGPATITVLQAANPKIKIIGSSGLDMKGAEAVAFRLGCGHFVPKPFTAESLLQALHAVLQEKAAEPPADDKTKTKKKRD